MDTVRIERRGGFAGLKAKAEVDVSLLDDATRVAIDELFAAKTSFAPEKGADRYVYVLTRGTGADSKSVEVPERLVPAPLAASVKDSLP
jgi:hypothetical protein